MRTRFPRIVFALVLVAAAIHPAIVRAQTTYNITTTSMARAVDGVCTLAEVFEAIQVLSPTNECPFNNGPITINLAAGTYNISQAWTSGITTLPVAADIYFMTEIVGAGTGANLVAAATMQGFVASSPLTLRNVKLSGFDAGNALGGAILVPAGGSLNLEDVEITGSRGNTGGAVVVVDGTVNIHRSTFEGNEAVGGGMTIAVFGTPAIANIANSTVVASGTGQIGVGVFGGVANISSSTLSAPAAIQSAGTMEVRGSLILGPCLGSSFTLVASSVMPDNSSCGGAALMGSSLRTIANQGGRTRTILHELPHGPVDAVPIASCTYVSQGTNPLFAHGAPVLTDQRGVARDDDAFCDAGAFESFPITSLATTFYSVGMTVSDSFSTSVPGTFTWNVGGGTLPAGLTLSSAGALTGTLTTSGLYAPVVELTRSDGMKSAYAYGSGQQGGGFNTSISIVKVAQSITFPPLGAITFGAAPPTPGATASPSGLAVTYTSLTMSVCTVTGSAITVLTGGTCTLQATQAGDAMYNAAAAQSQSLTINPATQAINFPPLGSVTFGSPAPVLGAIATPSGLGITYTSLTLSTCTVAASVLTIVAAGPCTVRASQAGNANYLAAADVDRSFTVAAVVPGAPTITAATGTLGSVAVTFSAPASSGGSPITSYTATCGAQSATGTGSPITVTGLPGGATSCTVTATNIAGAGPASAPFAATTPTVAYTGPTATGSGTASIALTGGGPLCSFAPAGTGPLQSSFFIPLTGHAKSPAGAAPNATFPHGLLDFVLVGCTPGSTVTIAVTFPNPVNASMSYWKYGPTPGNAAPHWYTMPSTITGNTFTFSIVDGGLGDDDLAANGTIVDQGGPGIPGAPGSATAIPTLSEWMLALLALLIAGSAWRREKAACQR